MQTLDHESKDLAMQHKKPHRRCNCQQGHHYKIMRRCGHAYLAPMRCLRMLELNNERLMRELAEYALLHIDDISMLQS
jgi:hypothetical protein